MEKRDTGETAWSDSTGGERGERFPIFNLFPAFGVVPTESELIECPVCQAADEVERLQANRDLWKSLAQARGETIRNLQAVAEGLFSG